MEYTPPTAISRGLAVLSPTDTLIASANGNVLELHDITTNGRIHELTTAAPITHIVWASTNSPASLTSQVADTPSCKHPFLAVASRGGNVVVLTAAAVPVADIHNGRLEIAWLSLASPSRLLIGYEHGFGVALYDVDPISPSLITFLPYAIRPPPVSPFTAATRVVSPCGLYTVLVVRDRRIDTNPDVLLVLTLTNAKTIARVSGPAGLSYIDGIKWAGNAIVIWGYTDLASSSHRAATLSVTGKVVYPDICRAYYRDFDIDDVNGQHDLENKYIDNNSSDLDCLDSSRISAIAFTPVMSSASSMREKDKNKTSFSAAVIPKATAVGLGLAVVARQNGLLHVVDLSRGYECKRFSHRSPEADESCAPLVFREVRRTKDMLHDDDDTDEVTINDGNGAEFSVDDWAPSLDIGRAPRVSGDLQQNAISWMEISPDGTLLASRDVCVPHVVFIWDLRTLRLAVILIMCENVISAKWNNSVRRDNDNAEHDDGCILAIACAGPWIYLWQRKGAAAVSVAADQHERTSDFAVRRVRWAADDSALLLVDGLTARAFVTMYRK